MRPSYLDLCFRRILLLGSQACPPRKEYDSSSCPDITPLWWALFVYKSFRSTAELDVSFLFKSFLEQIYVEYQGLILKRIFDFFCEKNMLKLPIYHRMRVIGVVICWFHHHITPCLIVPSILVNSIIVMDYLAMYFHPLGDLYLWKLCSHLYSRFERLSKKIYMNINSQLYSSFHMGCIFFFYINMSIPCKKCLYLVIIVKPKVVSWYNEYDL